MIKTVRFKRYIIKVRRTWARFGQTRAAIFFLTALLTISPFFLTSYNHHVQDWLSNRAMAATMAAVRSGQGQDFQSEQDRIRHGRAVKTLVSMDPDALLKLRNDDVLSGFDRPDLRRREGNIVVFQYQAETCVLDVFFKEDGEIARVIHYEVRPRRKASISISAAGAAEQVDADSCIQAL